MITQNLIGTAEAAAILGVTATRVRAMCATYCLGDVVSGRWVFDRKTIEALAAERKIHQRRGGPRPGLKKSRRKS